MMKKWLSLLLAAALLLTMLCGLAEQPEQPAGVELTAGETTLAPNLFRRSLAYLRSGATVYADSACQNAVGVTDSRARVYIAECAASANLLQMSGSDVLKITYKKADGNATGYAHFKDLTYLTADELAVYGAQPIQGISPVSFEQATVETLGTAVQEFIDTADTAPAATVGPLRFGTQPHDVTAFSDEMVTFFAKVGDGALVSYAWEVCRSDSTLWTSMGNTCDQPSLTVSAAGKNGYRYRCIISDGARTVTSAAATLTVITRTELKITAQPASLTVKPGDEFTFSVTAQGDGLTYVWELSMDDIPWTVVPDITTPTITDQLDEDADFESVKLRCIVTDKWGNSVTSNVATLTVLHRFTTVIDGVRYTEIEIGSKTLFVESYTGSASTLTVKGTVEGMPVIQVGPSAFENNRTLTCIDLPDSIQIIGKRAFAGCTNLKEMK